MIDYIYKRSIVKIREMSCGSILEVKKGNEDAIYLHSLDPENLLQKGYAYVEPQLTILTDLTLEQDILLSKVSKNCRYEIRRAIKEGVIINNYDSKRIKNSKDMVNAFIKTYNDMFLEKGMNCSFNSKIFDAGVEAGQIFVSTATDPNDDKCTVYHAYLIDGSNTVLMYSASPLWVDGDKKKANMIGRLNKSLHWSDILWFKSNGYTRYEWGGIASKDNPNGIDKFKMEFGGEIVEYYNYHVGCTLIGKLYCLLIKIKKYINIKKAKKSKINELKAYINIDDYGMDERVNQSVVYLFSKKLVDRTTLMVNMPYCEDAVNKAKENGFMDKVGLHLNMTEGFPLTEKIKKTELCNQDGSFNGDFLFKLKNRLFLNADIKEAVIEEIDAQIRKYLSFGFELKHIDSHQHIHTNWSIFKLLLPELEKYNFTSIRYSFNYPKTCVKGIKGIYKRLFNKKVNDFNKKRNKDNQISFYSTLYYVNELFNLENNEKGTIEYNIHTSINDEDNLYERFNDGLDIENLLIRLKQKREYYK